jgi:N-acetylglucosamine kinase
MESYFAGVEGGATRTTLMILNGTGNKVVEVNGDGTNLWLIGIPEVVKRISKMAKKARDLAGIPDVKFKAIGLSLSGCEQEETNKSLENEIRRYDPNLSDNYVVCSDTLGSIFTASGLGGLVVIAGTGSNVCLRNPNGKLYNCGGWGHMLGDEGGAYWIAWRAVKTIFDHKDNLDVCPYDISTVWELIKAHFNVQHRNDILEHCYAKFDKSFYARLCHKLANAAHDGDQLCLSIFQDAGRQLARQVAALLPRVDPELTKDGYLSMVCVGSVWLSFDLLKDGFLMEIQKQMIPYEIRFKRLKESMAMGATYLAADSIKFDLPRDYTKNYEVFFCYESELKQSGINSHCNGSYNGIDRNNNNNNNNNKTNSNGNEINDLSELNGLSLKNGCANGITV